MLDISGVIEANIGLIKTQLRRFNLLNDPDAESLGYEALWSAAESYDEARGYKFSTYATCCIYNILGSYIRTKNKKRQLEVISYNNPVGDDDDFLSVLSLVANSVEDTYLNAELKQKIHEAAEFIAAGIRSDNQLAIFTVWRESGYLLAEKEVARIVGVSQPYVSQILSTMRAKLRKRLESYYNV